jgi:hypothetical protein
LLQSDNLINFSFTTGNDLGEEPAEKAAVKPIRVYTNADLET